jgi:hypothetical protein
MRWSRPVLAVAAVTALVAPATAATFTNSYLSFSLPAGWSCQPEDTEYVCTPPRSQGAPTNAIMILTAKLEGPGDTLAEYRRHLAGELPSSGPGEIVEAPKLTKIAGNLWIDAVLLDSEVRGYHTRYLATTLDGLAILFTFSAHRTVFDDLDGVAVQAVHTLQVRDEWRTAR